jgi:hypothetical protein
LEVQVKIGSLFKTTTTTGSPLDGSGTNPSVSGFLTIQSLTNFAAMTGAITAAWRSLQRLKPEWFSAVWVAYAFAAVFALVSILTSLSGLRKDSGEGLDAGSVLGAIFIAVINALVLASAVVGIDVATNQRP